MLVGRQELRQLRRIRRSVNRDSAATLVHAFVTSRVDYCNAFFAAGPKVTTNKLQQILNAAAHVVTGTRKFDRGLSQLLHTELHWLDVPERVKYKLSVMVHWCLGGCAPQYWRRTVFRSLQLPPGSICILLFRHQLAVPSHRLSTVWSSGFCNCRPDDVELTANTPSSCGEWHRCIWMIT